MDEPFPHAAAPHGVPSGAAHVPASLHVPCRQLAGSAVQLLRGFWPAAIAQVPMLPARLHASHVAQALWQQTPSTQKPDTQSESARQLVPMPLGAHFPSWQAWDEQSDAAPHE